MMFGDTPGAIGLFISTARLRYGVAGALWFAFLWYLTAPLVLLRPFARLWSNGQRESGRLRVK